MAEQTTSLWDLSEGERRRDRGIALASLPRGETLTVARETAVALAQARESREASIDDVKRHMEIAGLDPSALDNAAGAVFRGSMWADTGKRIRSARAVARAREIRIWRLL